MSSTTPQMQTPTPRPVGFAVGGAATSAALTAYGTFKENNLSGDLPGWLFLSLPIIAVATGLVFGVVVRPALRKEHAEPVARTALVLALLAVASVAVASLGLNAVLAASAICVALAARQQTGRWTTLPGAAITLSAAAIVLAVAFAVVS